MKTATNPYRFKHIGSVSHGTLRPEDLIPAFMDALQELNPERAKELEGDAERILAIETDDEQRCDDDLEESSYFLNETLVDALNACAPTGIYFGSHPGDGSNFGFWVSEWFAEDFDGFKSSREQEYPDDDYQGEWLHVNDHGNVTLYVRENGQDFEVWSCV